MKLTKNFNLKEFICKDGSVPQGLALQNIKTLAENLQILRDYLGKPIVVTSGYRSIKYNSKLPGASKVSQHLIGRAADIKVAGIPPQEVAKAIEHLIASGKMKQGGIGAYNTFTHYDIRGTRARWQV